MRPELFVSMVVAALALTACPGQVNGGGQGGGATAGGNGGSGGSGGAGGEGGGEVSTAQSAKAVVRFKRNTRITNDFAQALGLPASELCKELGAYSCTELVHPLALGGVDPYGAGLYEPLPFTGVTSPIVADRVALSACITRVGLDLATPGSAVIFKNLALQADGTLDPSSAAATAALGSLYERVMLRPITDAERDHFVQLYRDVEASGKPDAGKSWLTLSCFAVLTSTESLFY